MYEVIKSPGLHHENIIERYLPAQYTNQEWLRITFIELLQTQSRSGVYNKIECMQISYAFISADVTEITLYHIEFYNFYQLIFQ